jgi:hypothetical protein
VNGHHYFWSRRPLPLSAFNPSPQRGRRLNLAFVVVFGGYLAIVVALLAIGLSR